MNRKKTICRDKHTGLSFSPNPLSGQDNATTAVTEEEPMKKEIEFFARLMEKSAGTLPAPSDEVVERIHQEAVHRANRRRAGRVFAFRPLVLWPAIAAALLILGWGIPFHSIRLAAPPSPGLVTTHRILTLMEGEPRIADYRENAVGAPNLETLADRLLELQDMQPDIDPFNVLRESEPEPWPTSLQWHSIHATPDRKYG